MSNCILVNTSEAKNGYGQVLFRGKITRAHRAAWIEANGEIPEGMVIDHTCHDPAICEGGFNCEHRRCVNPEHLSIVTSKENSQRSVRLLKYKTHCRKGHSLENNTIQYPSRSTTLCRTCKQEARKKSRAKKKVGV